MHKDGTLPPWFDQVLITRRQGRLNDDINGDANSDREEDE
jgi:hypothetical protein